MVYFRFRLCDTYLSLRDAFRVCQGPTDLGSLSNWALRHLWAQSGCSSGWSWVGLLEGWLSAQGRDGPCAECTGILSQWWEGKLLPVFPVAKWGTRDQSQHHHCSSCALSTGPEFKPLGFSLVTAVPKCIQLAPCSKQLEFFSGILSLAAFNSLWSPA